MMTRTERSETLRGDYNDDERSERAQEEHPAQPLIDRIREKSKPTAEAQNLMDINYRIATLRGKLSAMVTITRIMDAPLTDADRAALAEADVYLAMLQDIKTKEMWPEC